LIRSTLLIVLLSSCTSLTGPGYLVPPTVDEDPVLPQAVIEVSGKSRALHLQTFGDPANPPLFFMHGSLADHRAFLPFRELADAYFVVMWDQRGMGLSERISASEFTEQSIIEEIDAVRTLYANGRQLTLIGHSFGAMFAALYISSHPENVRQAILMEPAGLTGGIFEATFGDLFNMNLFARGLNEGFWQTEVLSPADHEQADYKALMMLLDTKQMNYFCDPDSAQELPVWRPGALLEALRPALLGASASGAGFSHDYAFGLHAFEPEVLLIAGECSALGPAFQEKHHMPLFKHATLRVVPNAGHRMFVEQYSFVIKLVRDYLSAEVPQELTRSE